MPGMKLPSDSIIPAESIDAGKWVYRVIVHDVLGNLAIALMGNDNEFLTRALHACR